MLRKMWKVIPLLFIFIAPSARADLVHRLSTSTQLTVNGAATSSTRVGSTYSVSGSNIKVGAGNSDVFGGLTAGTATAAAFLSEFVPLNTSWVHLDIAANMMTLSDDRWHNKGATGIPTRLLIELANKLQK